MRIPLALAGFEGQDLAVDTGGLWRGPRLLQGEVLAPKGPRRGTVALRRNDGTPAVARIRPRALGLDPVPDVDVDGRTVHLSPPLAWYEWAWAALPVLLLFVGGAIGGVAGVLAAHFNLRLFRSERGAAEKYSLTGLVNLAALVAYVVLAVVFRQLIGVPPGR